MYTVCYPEIAGQLQALVQDVPYPVANLANAAALLWQALPGINWVGFYKKEGDVLILGPFQGKPACIRIPLGKGVCGTAAALDQVQRVADVHCFPGHIACDSASNSEIVLPIHVGEEVWGVLDIDSPERNRFTREDQAGLETIVAILEKSLG